MDEYYKAKYSLVSDNPRMNAKLSELKETWLQIISGVLEFSALYCVGVAFLYFLLMSVRGE